ncbi:type IV secretory system conjugative DNA transfer family protein [Cytobacillus purgationiresistens]|uniref:TraD/TraG TraM recognition site domain-containing protein n=1 Tax=Cytobacillus purgationiresistens TaxID=863449 RepID=A0ABU0AKA9_9BACI|nr:TraM recognition domain-containing protein [Cytobacillus purgationiresistens]MDQ0271207.1 hypothetical protein [Cytobacillus purgationiresistens]
MNEKPDWKMRLPKIMISILVLIMLYFTVRNWLKVASLIMSQHKKDEIFYLSSIMGETYNIHLLTIVSLTAISVITWLLSTRVKLFSTKYMKLGTFILSIFNVVGSLLLYGMNTVKKNVIPFFEARLTNIIETSGFFESIVFEHTDAFYMMVLLIPLICMMFIILFVLTKYIQFEKELKESFFEYEWSGKWQQKFARLELEEVYPDVELGPNSITGEMVILPGKDRTLNTAMVGSIGTGKTAAVAKPLLNQDLHHMTRFINHYADIFMKKNYQSEEVSGRYLNGISVIEPSNELCKDIHKLAKAHGIPDEAITYIDPLNPDTPSLNPMKGPVDKVAEVFAQVIAGLSDSNDGGNFFFEQAQRNHFKHYIYLLKLHDPDSDVSFDMLLDMYNNPQEVRKMHLKLKDTIPKDISQIDDRDIYNHWKIVQGIDEWFDLNLIPLRSRQGIPERDDRGEVIFEDGLASDVKGLRNILNDIGNNIYIRRVLFGKSDFDFDRHFELGGILLVNTAKGELVNLARVLGKIVLMNLQNATFRREPKVSPYHHILVDEAPDYLYHAFREFPVQSRKYKVILTTLKQTIAQLADQFGEHYMTTILGGMRNRLVYGDVPPYDAKFFSEMFGEKKVYEEGQNEMSVSPLQEDPMSRSGSSFARKKEQTMSTSDIMFQDAFQCAVKIVVNNKPMPVVQIKANFVPDEEFEQAVVTVEEDKLKVWLQEREFYNQKENDDSKVEQIKSIEATEIENRQLYESEKQSAIGLDSASLEKVLSVKGEPRPRDTVNYKTTPTHVDQQTMIPAAAVIDQSQFTNQPSPTNVKESAENVIVLDKVNASSKAQADHAEEYKPSEITQDIEDFADSLLKDSNDSLFEDIDYSDR